MVAACLNSPGTAAFPEGWWGGRWPGLEGPGFCCSRRPPCCVHQARVLLSLNSVSTKVPQEGEGDGLQAALAPGPLSEWQGIPVPAGCLVHPWPPGNFNFFSPCA